jgi:hypothetical protein
MYRYRIWAISALGVAFCTASPAFACPDGYAADSFGICWPTVGGAVGDAFEKAKREAANFERDARVWIETGKCGGDICDAFKAAVEFAKAEIVDTGRSLENAGRRISEGKPLDAVWHLGTDALNNTQENAADAAKQSRVLAATGQVAASVYGGPQGAAAYTAWLTYNTTGKVGDALKAGLIAGVAAAALGDVRKVKLTGAEGIAARAVLSGAISGAAVAASGGKESDIKAAFGMGVAMVVIQEAYREYTKFDLDNKRLKSSTSEAYCLAEGPTSGKSCLPPQEAYVRNADNTIQVRDGKPVVDFSKLDPDRPHVGLWSREPAPLLGLEERSGVMTGISRLPGWNAMAVFHDTLAEKVGFDLVPGGIVATVGTIPPSVILTYMGSEGYVQQMIRETYLRKQQDEKADGATVKGVAVNQNPSPTPATTKDPRTPDPIEMTHIFCGVKNAGSVQLKERTDLEIKTALITQLEGTKHRLCEIRQLSAGQWYELGHAHYQKNYCHDLAARIVRNRLDRGFICYGTVGLNAPMNSELAAKSN